MVHTMEGLSLKSPLRSFNVLVFLLLMHFYEAQSQAMAPSQAVVSMLGGDAVLPCRLEAGLDAAQLTVEWGRPDLEPRFVYIWHNGKELTNNQNAAFKGRVSMSTDELKQGNASLKLTQLKTSDNGRYRCYIPKQEKEYFMELLVGSVSSPGISLAGLGRTSSSVVLQCESAGWYPEPEVLWLDAEGNLLSAGPTETLRGPDDLYTVSSRVTVEKKHGNKFTCRVQQNNINQSRDTRIHVPDDFFVVQSCSTSTTVSLAVCMVVSIILFILAVVVFVHMRRQNRTKRREDVQVKSEEEEALMLMKTLEKEKQPESKRVNKEAEVSLLVDEERHQDQLKEEELNPEEQQRKKEAENMIQRLQEKLDMKKTEVKNKQSELQRFQEEKKKIQEDLKNLIKDLNTKNTKLKTIREELKSFWPSILSSEKQKKEDKKRIQTEIANLSKQLMTKNTEFQNKDEECEEKQVELKQLLDDQQKMEIKLQIEEQKLGTNKMKKEYDDIKNQLQQETEERKKAENEVKILKNDLKELQNEKQKWTESEGKLKTELQEMKEINQNSSASRRSMTAPIILEMLNTWENYIRLRNISSEEINLEGWKLKLKTTTRGPTITKWNHPLIIKPEGSHYVNIDFTAWRTGELQITLISNEGKEYRLQ